MKRKLLLLGVSCMLLLKCAREYERENDIQIILENTENNVIIQMMPENRVIDFSMNFGGG